MTMEKMNYKTSVYDFGEYKPKNGYTNHWFVYITEQDIYEVEYPSAMTWEVYIKLSNYVHIMSVGFYSQQTYKTEEDVLRDVSVRFEEIAKKYFAEVNERDAVNRIKNPWMYEDEEDE